MKAQVSTPRVVHPVGVLTDEENAIKLRRRAGLDGAWGTPRQRANDYAKFRDRHIHNPNCSGGSHRVSETGDTYPGTTFLKAPKKWTWRDYKAAALHRRYKKKEAT